MIFIRRSWRCVAVGTLALGCGDVAGLGPAQGITVAVVAAGLNQATVSSASGAVHIDRLRLVLGTIKLETAGVDGSVDWVLDGSRVVVLDLTGEPVTAEAAIAVPAGTYKEIEISIDKLESGDAAEETIIAQHPDVADASIAITGRVSLNGGADSFVFTAALDRDMEILLDPVLVIGGGDEPTGVRVTLVLRTERWFLSAAGECLDPRDPANRSAIEANIQTSLEAFEDGDLDGQPGPIVR